MAGGRIPGPKGTNNQNAIYPENTPGPVGVNDLGDPDLVGFEDDSPKPAGVKPLPGQMPAFLPSWIKPLGTALPATLSWGGQNNMDFVQWIAAIMTKKIWTKAPVLQNIWRTLPAQQMSSKDDDFGKLDTAGKPLKAVGDVITMDWVLNNFPSAKKVYEKGQLGLWKSSSEVSDKAKKNLEKRLHRNYPELFPTQSDGSAKTVKFGTYQNKEIPKNPRALDEEYLIDKDYEIGYPPTLDELLGALANFTFYYFLTGEATSSPEGVKVKITGHCSYLFDSFDFNGDQFLGWWKWPDQISIHKPSILKNWHLVTNETYQDYRKKTGLGGDFAIYSDVYAYILTQKPIEFTLI